jgi:hypothetical protein
MPKRKRKQKEYWDKNRQSRPQENKPAEYPQGTQPERLTQQQPVAQQGLRLPSPAGQGQKYLVEANDGTLVRVSEENLNEWSEAQKNAASGQLNKGEERVLARVLEMIYGKEEE